VDFSTGKPVYEMDDIMIGYSYITDSIKDIIAKYQLSPEQIYLMGFSQ
jgi:predicted esterase